MAPKVREIIEDLKGALDGSPRPERQFDFSTEAIYGGLSGCEMQDEEFLLAPGLALRPTFAHVIAPYVMAFAKPDRPGKPHPGPWRAVSGGDGFDVTIEMSLDQGAMAVAPFDRMNTLWWALSLLRLVSGAPLRMPVLCDMRLSAAAHSEREPRFWPVEIERLRLPAKRPPVALSPAHLIEVRELLVRSATMMESPHFRRAFQTFDSAFWAHSIGSGLTIVWSALETLFRPGQMRSAGRQPDIGKVLSRSIATFTSPAGAVRERQQQRIATLYKERGLTVHDLRVPEIDVLLESVDIARNSFVRCLADREMPDCERLSEIWQSELGINSRTGGQGSIAPNDKGP